MKRFMRTCVVPSRLFLSAAFAYSTVLLQCIPIGEAHQQYGFSTLAGASGAAVPPAGDAHMHRPQFHQAPDHQTSRAARKATNAQSPTAHTQSAPATVSAERETVPGWSGKRTVDSVGIAKDAPNTPKPSKGAASPPKPSAAPSAQQSKFKRSSSGVCLSQVPAEVRSGELATLAQFVTTIGENALRGNDIKVAEDCFRYATELLPDSAAVWNNLGTLLRNAEEYPEARQALLKAVELEPGDFDNWYLLGVLEVLNFQNRAASVPYFEAAMAVDPNDCKARMAYIDNIAYAGLAERAIDRNLISPEFYHCPRALLTVESVGFQLSTASKWEPAYKWYHLAHQMCLKAHSRRGEADAMWCARLRLAVLRLAEMTARWQHYESTVGWVERVVRALVQHGGPVDPCTSLGIVPLHALNHMSAPHIYPHITQCYLALALRGEPGLPAAAPPPRRQWEAPLRVGYLAASFGNHATGRIMHGLYALHDPALFRTHLYYTGSPGDASMFLRAAMRGAHAFRNLSDATPAHALKAIERDKLHVLINMMGHTDGDLPSVMVARPAPVQAIGWGWQASYGHPSSTPYIFTDPILTPPDAFALHYNAGERAVHIGRTHFYYQRPEVAWLSAPSPQELADLFPPTCPLLARPRPLVFANFGKVYKVNPGVFQAWINILHRVPNSVLWIMCFFRKEGDAAAGQGAEEQRLRAEAAALGIAPQRLVFTSLAPFERHLAVKHAVADLYLDTHPYGSHTTLAEALWAAVPAVTVMGSTNVARVGAGLVMASGQGQHMLTHSMREYEDRAVDLALTPGRLQALKQALKRSRDAAYREAPGGGGDEHEDEGPDAVLYDNRRWAAGYQRALLCMLEIEAEGLPPQHIIASDS